MAERWPRCSSVTEHRAMLLRRASPATRPSSAHHFLFMRRVLIKFGACLYFVIPASTLIGHSSFELHHCETDRAASGFVRIVFCPLRKAEADRIQDVAQVAEQFRGQLPHSDCPRTPKHSGPR